MKNKIKGTIGDEKLIKEDEIFVIQFFGDKSTGKESVWVDMMTEASYDSAIDSAKELSTKFGPKKVRLVSRKTSTTETMLKIY